MAVNSELNCLGERERMKMSEERGEIIHTDMSVYRPEISLARKWRENSWLLVDYETFDGTTGIMAFADPVLRAPEIELPLNAEGLYKIHLGVNYTKSTYALVYSGYSQYGELQVRLSGDLGFSRVGAETSVRVDPVTGEKGSKCGKGKFVPQSIQDTYWKTADLTGQSLIFRPPGPPFSEPRYRGIANLSWVRLVPLTPEEEEIHKKLQPTADTKRVAFLFCGALLSGPIDSGQDFHPTSKEWFEDEVQHAVDSDVDILSLEIIRGNYCAFRTKTGDVGGDDGIWKDEWVDPLEEFNRLGHEHGMKVFAAARMIGAFYPTSRMNMARAKFFREHPEWTKRDREGLPTTNHSIAFPEVREYWLTLFREALAYGIDGITLYLNRFKPFVLYERPVIDSFKAEYGEDPREVAEDDPRWIRHTADYLTAFLREVRKLVDEKPNRYLACTLYGGPSQYDDPESWDPIQYNCDVETWIREGLMDYLFPTQYPLVRLIRKWSELAKGKVHIWPDLIPLSMPGEEFARLAKEYYEAGADGISLRDGEGRCKRVTEWAVQRLLGHRDMLDHFIEAAPSYYRRVPLKSLGGFSTRYS